MTPTTTDCARVLATYERLCRRERKARRALQVRPYHPDALRIQRRATRWEKALRADAQTAWEELGRPSGYRGPGDGWDR